MNLIFEKLKENAIIPQHAYSSGDNGQHSNVGMDFHAAEEMLWGQITEGIYSCIVDTGLRVQLPHGYHLRFASRSGLGFKKNIQAFPGTVDSSYRGPLKIKLFAFSEGYPEPIHRGDKIAQGIVFQSHHYDIVEGPVSTDTQRSAKGFGSSDG